MLNRPLGRVYQKPCTAVLGDQGCRFDTSAPGFWAEAEIAALSETAALQLTGAISAVDGWFDGGRLDILTGAATGLWGTIKQDRQGGSGRALTLWSGIGGGLAVGDRVRLTAGCDKRMSTCRFKFNNLVNFQGFPDLPGEDWVMAVPKKDNPNSGGSRR